MEPAKDQSSEPFSKGGATYDIRSVSSMTVRRTDRACLKGMSAEIGEGGMSAVS